jgi:glycosyltransferase involved in cell wall biosynthesis
MKIGFVLTNFLPNNIGGTEVYVYRLIKYLERLNIISFVLIISKTSDTNEYVYNGIKIYEIPTIENQKSERSIYLNKIVEIEKPELIHVHELIMPNGFNYLDLLYFKQLNLPVITTLHLARYSCFMQNLQFEGSKECNALADRVKCSKCFLSQKGVGIFSAPLTSFSQLLHQKKVKFNSPVSRLNTTLNIYYILDKHLNGLEQIFKNSDYVIAISKWYYDALFQFSNQLKLKLIETGTLSRPEKVKIPNRTLVFAYIGRASYDKGLDLLIDAFLELNSSEYQLNIYAEYMSSVDDFIHALHNKTKLIANIKWYNSFEPDKIVEILHSIDVIVVPSRIVEMSPLVIHEGKSLNKYIVASYNKGIDEVLENYELKSIYYKNTTRHLLNTLREINPSKLFTNKVNLVEAITFDNTSRNYYELYEYVLSNKEKMSID